MAGVSVNVFRATARLLSVTELSSPFGSGVSLETVAWCPMAPAPVARARIVTSRPKPSPSNGWKSQVITVGVTLHVPQSWMFASTKTAGPVRVCVIRAPKIVRATLALATPTDVVHWTSLPTSMPSRGRLLSCWLYVPPMNAARLVGGVSRNALRFPLSVP